MAILVGDLRQRLIGHLDVVGGGVRVRVSRPQHPRQRLPGVVQPRQQQVIAKPVLERRRRLLLRMTGHQGGVHVDHQARQDDAGTPHGGNRPASLAAQQPGPFPGRRSCRLHLQTEARTRQAVAVEATDPNRPDWSRRAVRSPIATPAAVEHHRQISQHPARRMRRTTLPATADRAVERLRDTNRSSDVGQLSMGLSWRVRHRD